MSEQRQSIEPTHDHQETGDRFTVEVRECGKRLSLETLADPFIHTKVRPRGWRVALAVLRGRYEVLVHVSGDDEIVEDVMELNSDYLGTMQSTRRAEWDAAMERSLGDFAPR